MVRRLEIAQSTLHRPRVLFLDERPSDLTRLRRCCLETSRRSSEQLRYDLVFTTHYLKKRRAIVTHCNHAFGQGAALGTCKELEVSLGSGSRTLNDVFLHYAGTALDSGGTFRDVSAERATPGAMDRKNNMTIAFIDNVTGFIDQTFIITEFELRKLRHDFTELITRALQPALWMVSSEKYFRTAGRCIRVTFLT